METPIYGKKQALTTSKYPGVWDHSEQKRIDKPLMFPRQMANCIFVCLYEDLPAKRASPYVIPLIYSPPLSAPS